MVKKTQIKDTFRNIKKNIIPWIAISIVTMIGCGVFLGCFFYADALEEKGRDCFNTTNLEDFNIVSSAGLMKEDIESIKQVEGVNDAEGSWFFSDALMRFKDVKYYSKLFGITERISKCTLLEGRLPENETECALTEDTMKRLGISIGDTLSIETPDEKEKLLLKAKEVKVTACVKHPYSFDTGSENYIFLSQSAFDGTLAGNRYFYVCVEADAEAKTGINSSEYEKSLAEIEEKVNNVLKSPDGSGNMMVSRTRLKGFMLLENFLRILRQLSSIFIFLFVIVGVVVVSSTITIVIDNQKKLIGTMKAMGFRNSEIAFKYVSFGMLGVALGMVLAIALDLILQLILKYELDPMFCIGTEGFAFDGVKYTVLFIVEELLAFTVAVVVTWHKAVRTSAVELMSNTVKTASGHKQENKKRKHSLYSSLIFRNMKTDIARVICSVVIIMGSTIMIGVGFTLDGSLDDMMPRSADEIYHYEIKAILRKDAGLNDYEALKTELSGKNAVVKEVCEIMTQLKAGDYQTMVAVVTGDESLYPEFIELKNTEDPGKLTGPVLAVKMAEQAGLEKVDTFELLDGSYYPHILTADGIFKNFYGYYIFMPKDCFTSVFGNNIVYNTLLIRSDDKELASYLKDNHPSFTYTVLAELPEEFYGLRHLFKILVLVMLSLSVTISVFVLLNLVNIFVYRRSDELIIMGIHGFGHKRQVRYLLRETLVTTILGILTGAVLVSLFTDYLVRTVECGNVMFVRNINIPALICAGLLESFFALLINLFSFRRIRKLDLKDISR